MAITNKQKAVIAAIIVIGAVASGAVLLTRGQSGTGTAGHGEEHGHQHEHGQKRGHADGQTAAHENDHDHDHDAKAGTPQGAPAPHHPTVPLSEAQQQAANVSIEPVGPARIASTLQFPGEIRFNEDRTAHVVPRLAGVAQAVPAALGQTVKQGDVLAVIASTQLSELRSEQLAAQQRLVLARTTHAREKKLWEERISAEQDYLQAKSVLQEAEIAVRNAAQKLSAIGAGPTSGGLNRFELRAPFDGVIVEKHLALGESVKEDASIFTISDLSTVWAEFVISPKDLGSVRVGESVTISSTAFDERAQGKVSYVGALLGEQTRTARARVTLGNPGMGWRPGLFVTVSVTAGEAEVALTVASEAVQTVGDEAVVFVAVPGGFTPRPVKTGRSDGKRVEILSGLQAGMQYAASNSFLLKAELGKAGAAHDH